MLKSITGSPHAIVLENALSAAALRHKVISNNIANVNTPGFKRSEVVFEDVLQEKLSNTKLSMTRTASKHLAGRMEGVGPLVNTVTENSFRSDGNNVDIDSEMANMAKNNIYYDAIAQQLSRYYSGLKSVINEGRR